MQGNHDGTTIAISPVVMPPSEELYDLVSEPLGLWAFLRDLPAEVAIAMNAPTWRPTAPEMRDDEESDSWIDALLEEALRTEPHRDGP
jgi:hypothetical protein